jgi:hypothetical protein
MKRFALIGSSHAAALRAGYDLLPPEVLREASFTFFVSHVFYIPTFRIDAAGVLAASNPAFKHPRVSETARAHLMRLNGALSLDLSGFDGVVWMGLNGGETGDFQPYHPLLQFLAATDVVGLHEAGNPNRISLKTFHALLTRLAAQHICQCRAVNLFAPALPRTVVLMPPAIAATAFDLPVDPARPRADPLRETIDLFDDLLRTAFKAEGVDLIRQPGETRAANGLTRPKYNAFNVNIGEGHVPSARPPDPDHMNADYGRLCLLAILKNYGALAA